MAAENEKRVKRESSTSRRVGRGSMARNWSEVFAAAATAAVRNLDTDGVDYNDGLAWRCSRSSFAVMRTNLCEKSAKSREGEWV